MNDAYLSLGSNIDRRVNLCACLATLEREFGTVHRSTVYRCPAVGFEGRDFYNLVTRIRTDLDPESLDAVLKGMEDDLGRRRNGPRFSDRVIDIDLLLLGNHVGRFGPVELPRPDILAYDFVLGPLADLAPELVHPVAGRSIESLWADMAADGHSLVPVELDC